jgi:hypothetical protein
MNTENKEHVVTEVYYPLGRKVPYLRRTGQPMEVDDPELQTCSEASYQHWMGANPEPKTLDGFYEVREGTIKRGDLVTADGQEENMLWASLDIGKTFKISTNKASPIWRKITYRPLEVGEIVQEGDEYKRGSEWVKFKHAIGCYFIESNHYDTRTTRPKPSSLEPVYRPLEPDEEPQPGDEVFYGSAWMRSEFIGELGDELRKLTRTTRPKPTKPTPNFDPKGDEGKKKPQLQLIPPVLNTELAKALSFGTYHRKEPYGPWNWRKNKVEYMTYLGAMKRHIDALLEREDVASDSGVHHLGHIAASCAIVLDAAKHGTLVDNRPPAKLNSEPVVDNGAFKGVE